MRLHPSLPLRDLSVVALLGVLLAPSPAYAYVDPGAGSLVLQLLIGGIAGGLMALRMFRARIRQRWRAFRDRRAQEK